jgi:hypothetical protein
MDMALIKRRPIKSWVETVESPYGVLLMLLLVILTLYPLLVYFPVLHWGLSLATLAIIAAALQLVHRKGLIYYLTLVLGCSTFLADMSGHFLEIKAGYPLASGLRTLFMAQLIVAIFIDVMKRKKVTVDAVLGACCVLIMLALAFGSTFILIEWIAPGSFHFPDDVVSTHAKHLQSSLEFELNYFSLVTITTIGYGDIYPVLPAARSLATLEGLLSQLYLAIVLARLVGLEISGRLLEQKTDED